MMITFGPELKRFSFVQKHEQYTQISVAAPSVDVCVTLLIASHKSYIGRFNFKMGSGKLVFFPQQVADGLLSSLLQALRFWWKV